MSKKYNSSLLIDIIELCKRLVGWIWLVMIYLATGTLLLWLGIEVYKAYLATSNDGTKIAIVLYSLFAIYCMYRVTHGSIHFLFFCRGASSRIVTHGLENYRVCSRCGKEV